MAAYAEGLNILKNANAGKVEREMDAETAPLEHPEYYQYDLDIPEVAEVWRRGSVIGSWLLDLTAASLQESPDLSDFAGRVSDSGEGRWTSIAAIEEGVPAGVLTTALYERFASRDLDDFADKVLSAMRYQFGGHKEKPYSERPPARGFRRRGGGPPPRRRADRRGRARRRRRPRPLRRWRSAAAPTRGRCSPSSRTSTSTGTKIEIFQVDERVAPAGIGRAQPHPPDREPLDRRPGQHPADAGDRRRSRRRRRPLRGVAPGAPSTSPTSASARTATRPRWSPATRCSR